MNDMVPEVRTRELVADDPGTVDTAARSTLFIGSTEKTFRVLHAFDGAQRFLTMAEIASVAHLDRSSVQRIVHTLESLGYLRRQAVGKSYGLTCKVLQFSYNYVRGNELIERASPYLLDVSRTVGETSNLHELDGADIVFIARFPGKHLVNIDIAVGSRLPACFTASGTAILSRLPRERQIEILGQTSLQPITPWTETDPERLLQRVQHASDTGYSIIANETVMGDISVAAPITDHGGRAIAAVNLSVPTTRWTFEEVEERLVHQVQVVATSISKARLLPRA